MDIEAVLDDWSYQHRQQDALQHSAALLREHPMAMAQPVGRRIARWHSVPVSVRESREAFLHVLQSLDSAGYGAVATEEREADDETATLVKLDHATGLKKLHRSLLGQMKRVLDAPEHRLVNGQIANRLSLSRSVARLTRRSESEPYAVPKKFQLKHREEIDELEAKLRDLRYGPSQADTAFYDLTATRETNELIESVLRDALEDIAVEAYENAEASRRKRELPPDQLAFVVDALEGGPETDVLVQKFNVDLTRRHVQCLLPLQWLNDEIINFYFQLMGERDQALVEGGKLAKRSHFFNSFFYTKVSENGYNYVNVRRWTRKIDLFAMDKIFIPVNISNMHWTLAVIYMSEKRIHYYDSMNGNGEHCVDVLFRYLHDEMDHKKKQKFDDSGWELVATTPNTPQQNNGSDCGVFASMFADYISQNLRDMEFHRHRMVLHIVQGCLPLDEDLP